MDFEISETNKGKKINKKKLEGGGRGRVGGQGGCGRKIESFVKIQKKEFEGGGVWLGCEGGGGGGVGLGDQRGFFWGGGVGLGVSGWM